MSEPQSDTVLQRLERLEQEVRQCKRESRWWRLAGSGAVVALVVVLLVGATGSNVAEEIRARQFTLVDESGMILFKLSKLTTDTLTGQPKNETRMSFFDKDGEERLALGIFQLTASYGAQRPVVLLRSKPQPTVFQQNSLALDIDDGTPSLHFSHHSATRMRLGLAQDGSPDLVVYHKDGRESQIMAGLPSQTRTWVLWEQPPVSTVSGLTLTPIALGAWPTQSQCEAEAPKLRQQQGSGQTVRLVYTCLPDTVNLRTQP